MNEKLNDALNEISDKHIIEATKAKKKAPYWFGAVAAVLVAALLVGILWHPSAQLPTVQGTLPGDLPRPSIPTGTLQLPNLLAGPEYPKMVTSDLVDSSVSPKEWFDSQNAQYNQPAGYADSLDDFFARSIPEFLSGEGNQAYSPVNLYLALAMLAESANGSSRQQLLDLLGADSIEALRTQAGHVWNAHYSADGLTASILANSLWMDDSSAFNAETVQTLADSYYASLFSGDLGTEEMNEQLRQWINYQTGGLLENQTKELTMDANTVCALVSTICFSAQWKEEFEERNTANGVFHCADKNLVTSFMNRTSNGIYYRGENFGAVRLEITGQNAMWLILPDEGITTQEVLKSGEYLSLTQNYKNWENKKSIQINLSLPRFDISSRTDLVEGMKRLGVTDVFSPAHADLSNLLAKKASVNKIDHAVRVAIDEEGITAAAFTVIETLKGGIDLPSKSIDFILDRPFLFVVSSRDNLPLFAGIVAEP